MKPFELAIADSRTAALAALGKGYAPRAGGVDVVDRLKERTEERAKFVSILRARELHGIREEGNDVVLGALSTLREIAASDVVRREGPALALACGSAASPQLRAVATIGGNLCQRPRCWYFRLAEFPCLKKGGSTCYAVEGENEFHAVMGGGPCHIVHPSNAAVPLLALGGSIVAAKPDGTARTIPAADFFVPPSKRLDGENVLAADELITEVRFPKGGGAGAWADIKQRDSFDWPLAACAAVRRGTDWRVVLGAAAPVPWRSTAAEKVLAGKSEPTDAQAREAAAAALAEATPMSGNAWRVDLLRAAVRRAVLAACGGDPG